MAMASFLLFACAALSTLSQTLAQTLDPNCPILGPDFPAPIRPAQNPAVSDAVQQVEKAVETFVDNATSDTVSLEVYSIYENEPLLTFHRSAPSANLSEIGTQSVDSDSIYRVASISKLFTVYTYLAAVGDATWNRPVTDFVPELAQYAEDNQEQLERDRIGTVDWKAITVGALASHLAGITRSTFSPSGILDVPELLNLPKTNVSLCGDGWELPCDRDAFFEALFDISAVVPPFSTPAYSNTAFAILGYVIENLTGKSFSDAFDEYLAEPLDLKSTTPLPPLDFDSTVVPTTMSLYNQTFGEYPPAGGFFSSINDMTKIGRSILNSTLLTPAETGRWLKPQTFTSDVNVSFGAPWEIFRAPSQRVSYMYTKAGGLLQYASHIVLIPDYGVGFTVLAAGPTSALATIQVNNLVVEAFYPALDAAARAQAEVNFAGQYKYPDPEVNTSVTLGLDDRPGLAVQQFILNGTNVLAATKAAVASQTTLGNLTADEGDDESGFLRLYPSGLEATDPDGVTSRVAFRAVSDMPALPIEPGPFTTSCTAALTLGGYVYSLVAADEVVFNLNEEGIAISGEPRILRQEPYVRVDVP